MVIARCGERCEQPWRRTRIRNGRDLRGVWVHINQLTTLRSTPPNVERDR